MSENEINQKVRPLTFARKKGRKKRSCSLNQIIMKNNQKSRKRNKLMRGNIGRQILRITLIERSSRNSNKNFIHIEFPFFLIFSLALPAAQQFVD